MPWTYSQSTGELRHNGALVGTGYSGAGLSASSGRNNPAMQHIPNQGPLPAGQYQIGASYSHPNKEPTSMNLTPAGHNALGRSGFMIHGNNVQTTPHRAASFWVPRSGSRLHQAMTRFWW